MCPCEPPRIGSSSHILADVPHKGLFSWADMIIVSRFAEFKRVKTQQAEHVTMTHLLVRLRSPGVGLQALSCSSSTT